MKKLFIFTVLLFFTVTTFSQSTKEARAAKREALKKERAARKALEAQQDSVAYFKAVEALKSGTFVLEADNVTFPNGISRFVSSSTNYVQADNGDGIVQTAFSNFAYSPGPNGLGGITVEGKMSSMLHQNTLIVSWHHNNLAHHTLEDCTDFRSMRQSDIHTIV